MKPHIDQLHAFLTLAETSHFTRAAERLGVSQSSLSATIHSLETRLNTRLFERHTRGCRLSEAGSALMPSIRRLTQEWDHLMDSAQDFASQGHGHLRIAAPTAQCAMLLPPIIRALTLKTPKLRVTVHDVGEQQIHDFVRNGVVDLGIATQTDGRTDLIATPFYSDHYIVALPRAHPLTRRKRLEWRQVADQPIIGPLTDNPVRQHLDKRLAEAGHVLKYKYEVSLPWTIVGMVREGLGIAPITMALQPLAIWQQLELRPVAAPAIARTLVLLRTQGQSLSAPANAFRNLLVGHSIEQTGNAKGFAGLDR